MKILIAAGQVTALSEHGSRPSRAPGHGWPGRCSSKSMRLATDGYAGVQA